MAENPKPTDASPLSLAARPRPALAARKPGTDEAQRDPRPYAGICDLLNGLDEAAKARASLVRSCKETVAGPEEHESLAELLRAITDQRRRIRAVRRVWSGLAAFEPPPHRLAETTESCVEECRRMGEVLDGWRHRTVDEVRRSMDETWRRLASAATAFTTEPGPS